MARHNSALSHLPEVLRPELRRPAVLGRNQVTRLGRGELALRGRNELGLCGGNELALRGREEVLHPGVDRRHG